MKNNQTRNILSVRGIGEKRADLLSKLGIDSVDALLRYYPRAYNDYTLLTPIEQLIPETLVTVRGKIESSVVTEPLYRQPISRSTFYISDGTGRLKIILFHKKETPFYLKKNTFYSFCGKVSGNLFDLTLSSPTVIFETESKIQAVYSLKSGISQSVIKNSVKAALSLGVGNDIIPQEIRKKYGLCDLDFAIKNIHFPLSSSALNAAKKRLVFEELFTLQTAYSLLKNSNKNKKGIVIKNDYTAEFFAKLPFSPTKAQIRVTNDCIRDMQSGSSLNRLVQGDVGSGKTAVAAALCYTVAKNGFQAAIMAPTEILAEQHFKSFNQFFNGTGIKVGLFTGSLTASNRKKLKEDLTNGKINVAVGTHALISDWVDFNNLALVITDEQHRFGVAQRTKLSQKSEFTHRLVMSATPIPRTLGLIIYGDLDLSIIDEYPKNRQVIDSYSVTSALRQRVYSFIKKNINEGRQAYIVCPAIEENEDEIASAEKSFKLLKDNTFKDYTVGLLHSKMKSSEKDKIMSEFKNGKINLLICTTVIEVGIDVPNATVMVIENAERFGLSQLHQLRGRIGRGSYKSTCIFISDTKNNSRLKIMCSTSDGFKIADEDLKLRGPGDFMGHRQHGLPELKIADLNNDMELLRISAQASNDIIKMDSNLSLPVHKYLKEAVENLLDISNN